MRTFRRFTVLCLLVWGSAGCDDGTTTTGSTGPAGMPSVAGDAFASPGQSGVQAPYGVIVDISYPGDAAAVGADSKVYVFLRKAGERMPLALQYFAAAELPKRVSLPVSEPLSGVELVARLSFSGRVERTAGDVEVSQWLSSVGHPPETVVLRLQEGVDVQSPPGTGTQDRALRATAGAADITRQAQGEPVSVRVRITAEQTEEFPADSTVFVLARSRTNPMPLAVKKLTLADLPAEIELSDADAMMFSHRLSTVDAFTLLARISRTGDAVRSAADLESPTVAVDAAAIPEMVTLTIAGSD